MSVCSYLRIECSVTVILVLNIRHKDHKSEVTRVHVMSISVRLNYNLFRETVRFVSFLLHLIPFVPHFLGSSYFFFSFLLFLSLFSFYPLHLTVVHVTVIRRPLQF